MTERSVGPDPDLASPEPVEPVGISVRLRRALDRLWASMADDYGLFPGLDVDAVLARADRGELAAATPRLVDLLVGGGLTVEEAVEVTTRLGARDWTAAQRSLVYEALDAWWLQVLKREPTEQHEPYRPGTVLGVLCVTGAPLVRWLEPWLAELDGPGANHLARVVLEGRTGLSGPAWQGREDEAAQVLAWARSETVVNGLTLVGGVHLDDGVLSDVLDRLLS